MEQNRDYVATCPIPTGIRIGIIILSKILNYVTLLANTFAGFFLSESIKTPKPAACADTCKCRNNGRKAMKPLRSSEETLSRREVEMVMERLGLVCRNPGGREDINDDDKLLFHGPQDISRVFEDQEPSFDEVKEAFNVFDTNCDGFIDASELRRVLHALGVEQVSERECRRVIRVFNDDGVIDLKEFTRLVEKSLS